MDSSITRRLILAAEIRGQSVLKRRLYATSASPKHWTCHDLPVNMREAVRASLGLLSERDRRLLRLAMVLQAGLSLLDLVGVLLIGLVAALSVTTVQSLSPPPLVNEVAGALGLEDVSDQALVLIMAAAAAGVLLLKSLVSSYLMRRVFVFLANRQAILSARLVAELLSRPITTVQRRSSQETAFALITGAGAATMALLGQLVVFVTEASLLMLMAVALMFLNPWVALGSIAFFAIVAFLIQRALGQWSTRTGGVQAVADIESLNAIQEAMNAYREIIVSNRRDLYIDRIHELRWRAARVAADAQFIGMFPKYIFEAALVLGGFALAGFLFATQNAVAAVATLAVFLAASTRVMPSILRMQAAALGMRIAAGAAGTTFELARDLDNPRRLDTTSNRLHIEALRHGKSLTDFSPSLQVSDVSFSYPESAYRALQSITVTVEPGHSLALVGPSGAGKSTLADVILGVLTPDEGTVALGGQTPKEAVSRWPGGIAYVPQTVTLATASVRENVALGLPRELVDDSAVWMALDRAHLGDFFRGESGGLDALVGENGVRLSGGQRQRMGLARALYTNPRFIVLDEATSALDAETEVGISQAIQSMEGHVTRIIIAHRLSTVRSVDTVAYIDQGRILAIGSFNEVVDAVPAFARQADLMGLS